MTPGERPTEQVAKARDEAEVQGRRLMDAHEASWALWAVLRTADEAAHAIAHDLGLPYTDALALDHVLSSAAPLGPVELGRRLGISSASATVLVDRLVASGHLTREPDPLDKRRRVLDATDRARNDCVDAMTPLLRALDTVAARLDKDTARAVISYLRDVADVQREYANSSRHRGPQQELGRRASTHPRVGKGSRVADPRFPGPDPAKAGLCCDFDGTLAPIVADPNEARMPDRLRPVLADLASRLGVLAVVSGRPASFLAERVGVPGARLLGLYGMEEWTGGRVHARPEVAEWASTVAGATRRLRAGMRAEGVWVEDKGLTVAVHWRNAPDRAAAERDCTVAVEALASETGLGVEAGKFVVELRPPIGWDKGSAVTELSQELGLATVAYLGDDLGDVVAFTAAQRLGGLAIAVTSGEETPRQLREAADLTLDGPRAVAAWLTQLRDRIAS
ncbi:MAG: trehalose-phosphatase [Egibacteraceae bacterium]